MNSLLDYIDFVFIFEVIQVKKIVYNTWLFNFLTFKHKFNFKLEDMLIC